MSKLLNTIWKAGKWAKGPKPKKVKTGLTKAEREWITKARTKTRKRAKKRAKKLEKTRHSIRERFKAFRYKHSRRKKTIYD